MQVRDIAKQLCQFFVFMLSCILYCLITSPPPAHTPPFICLFSYFRLFASNSPYFGSWLYNCSMNSLSLLFFFPQTESLFTGYNIIYMYPVGLYTKNSYWKKLGFLLKLNLDTCTATEVSKLSCHTHCIVNTQIRTCHLRPPNIITHKIIPLLGRKCNKLCWHLMTRTGKLIQKY